jgi:hypothetical protein
LCDAFIIVNNSGEVVEIVFVESGFVANGENGLSILLVIGDNLGKLLYIVSTRSEKRIRELSYPGSASRSFLADACRTG